MSSKFFPQLADRVLPGVTQAQSPLQVLLGLEKISAFWDEEESHSDPLLPGNSKSLGWSIEGMRWEPRPGEKSPWLPKHSAPGEPRAVLPTDMPGAPVLGQAPD